MSIVYHLAKVQKFCLEILAFVRMPLDTNHLPKRPRRSSNPPTASSPPGDTTWPQSVPDLESNWDTWHMPEKKIRFHGASLAWSGLFCLKWCLGGFLRVKQHPHEDHEPRLLYENAALSPCSASFASFVSDRNVLANLFKHFSSEGYVPPCFLSR